MADERPRFRVVRGGGDGTQRRGDLHPVAATAPRPPVQLALSGMSPVAATLASLGLDAIDYHRFSRLLVQERIRHIIDVRLSPTFRHGGFTADSFLTLVASLDISYRPMPELANRFLAESLNDVVVLERYALHLAQRTETLRMVREWVDQGPLLLLGWSHRHAESERAMLLDALARIKPGFLLRVLPDASDQFELPGGEHVPRLTANGLVILLRRLQSIATDDRLAILAIDRWDPRIAWETFPEPACRLPGIDVGQTADLRWNITDGGGLHIHAFPDRVEAHLDRASACADLVAHAAADTRLVEGAAIGALLGLLVGALSRDGRAAASFALVGAALGGTIGAATPARTRLLYRLRDLWPHIT